MWWLLGVHIYFPSHKQNTLFLHHWFGALYFYNYHELSSHFRPKPHGGVEDHSPFCYHPCCIIIVFYGPERTTNALWSFGSCFLLHSDAFPEYAHGSFSDLLSGSQCNFLSDACSRLPPSLLLLPIFIFSLICSLVLLPSNGIVICLVHWLTMCFSSAG